MFISSMTQYILCWYARPTLETGTHIQLHGTIKIFTNGVLVTPYLVDKLRTVILCERSVPFVALKSRAHVSALGDMINLLCLKGVSDITFAYE